MRIADVVPAAESLAMMQASKAELDNLYEFAKGSLSYSLFTSENKCAYKKHWITNTAARMQHNGSLL